VSHGKEGYVALNVSVPPATKDELLALAVKNGRYLVDEIREALAKHLNGGA